MPGGGGSPCGALLLGSRWCVRILEWFAVEVVCNATSMRPRDSRLQGVVFGFAGMRSLASVPIIRVERLEKSGLSVGYEVN